MIRESQRELHDFMIASFGVEYFAVTGTLTIAANSASVAPTHFIAARVHRVSAIFDKLSVPLRRRDLSNEVVDMTPIAWNAGMDLQVRIATLGPLGLVAGSDPYPQIILYVHPVPATTQLIHIVFTESAGSLSLSTAVNTLGYDEYLVLDCMAKLKEMEEVDASTVLAQKDRLRAAIEQTATPLDMGQPAVISDARGAGTERSLLRRYP